jgi:hypothetical protein
VFLSRKIRNLLDCGDIVELIVNAIPMLIKQNRVKETISSITIVAGEGMYTFEPSVFVEINGTNKELYLFELRPKELHYCLDAISGDANIRLNGDKEKIEPLFKEICSQLNHFKWETVCKPTAAFAVRYKI